MKIKINGTLLMLGGILHVVLGSVAGWASLKKIAVLGFWNALVGQSQAMCLASLSCMQINTFWWFVVFGLMLILIGYWVHWCEHHQQQQIPLPASILLAAIALTCAIIMPVSGFWLVVVIALNMAVSRFI